MLQLAGVCPCKDQTPQAEACATKISEKNEALALAVLQRLGVGVGRLGLVGQAAALKCGEGIFAEQGFGDFFAAAFGHGVECGAKLQSSSRQVVRVAGDEVDAILVQPLLGAFLRGASEIARGWIAR